jgi:branched-chain amino acid transport system ATP-binding protein
MGPTTEPDRSPPASLLSSGEGRVRLRLDSVVARSHPGAGQLTCTGVTKFFGGVVALKDVSLMVEAGGITGLIGPNGAGKTTLFNCMTGFLPPDSGEVVFEAKRVHRMRPYRVARLGMIRTFQSIRMFEGLTVYECVRAARHNVFAASRLGSRLVPGAGGKRRDQETIIEILAWLGLHEVRNWKCTELPLLTQRKVELARAIACEPLLLLLDEPSAGATPSERDELAQVIGELPSLGVTVLLIEHNVPFVASLCKSVITLNFGEVVAAGPTAEVLSSAVVQEVYLGS